LERFYEKDVEQYWKKKEDDIGEKIRGRMLIEYIKGYQNYSVPVLGILFYTESVFCFQTFPRKSWILSLLKPGEPQQQGELLNFCISWSNVKKIDFPLRKNLFLGFFLPQNFPVYIKYQNNENRTSLDITMHSQKDRDKLIEFYKKVQNRM